MLIIIRGPMSDERSIGALDFWPYGAPLTWALGKTSHTGGGTESTATDPEVKDKWDGEDAAAAFNPRSHAKGAVLVLHKDRETECSAGYRCPPRFRTEGVGAGRSSLIDLSLSSSRCPSCSASFSPGQRADVTTRPHELPRLEKVLGNKLPQGPTDVDFFLLVLPPSPLAPSWLSR